MKTSMIGAALMAVLLAATASPAGAIPYVSSGGYGASPHRQPHGSRHARHRHGGSILGSVLGAGHHGPRAGRAKQRHRTHLNRCDNVPSRC